MSERFVRWLQRRPRRTVWLGFWLQVWVAMCLVSLGTFPAANISVAVTFLIFIYFWRRFDQLSHDVDRDDGRPGGQQGPDQGSV